MKKLKMELWTPRKEVCNDELDRTQREHTSADACNLSWKWCGIWMQISILMTGNTVWTLECAIVWGALQVTLVTVTVTDPDLGIYRIAPKCNGFILLSALVISRVSWKAAGDCTRDANKSPTVSHSAVSVVPRKVGKWSRIRTRNRITKSKSFLSIGSPIVAPIKFQWNQLITFAVILLTDELTDAHTGPITWPPQLPLPEAKLLSDLPRKESCMKVRFEPAQQWTACSRQCV